MSAVLAHWNQLPNEEAAQEIRSCCGSISWARALAARRPLGDEASLLTASDEVWRDLAVSDWLEAFSSHPRIGEHVAPPAASAQSAEWSGQEQRAVAVGGDTVKIALAQLNQEYERRFNRIFIVCATGKSGTDILEILRRRLHNDEDAELKEAAEQQRQITHIRLRKWLWG